VSVTCILRNDVIRSLQVDPYFSVRQFSKSILPFIRIYTVVDGKTLHEILRLS